MTQEEIEQMKRDLEEAKARESALAAELEAKNDADEPAPAQPAPGELSDFQKQQLENKYGMSYEDLSKQSAFVADLINPIQQEAESLKRDLQAERNINSAKKAVSSSDPQFSKYEKHVDEYLEDVSDFDKADAKAFKKHMERAVKYAKGVARGESQETGGGRTVPKVDPINEDPDDFDPTKDDGSSEYFGTHMNKKGSIRLEVSKRVEDEFRKKNTHPDVVGGVQIDDGADWKGAEKELSRGRPEQK